MKDFISPIKIYMFPSQIKNVSYLVLLVIFISISLIFYTFKDQFMATNTDPAAPNQIPLDYFATESENFKKGENLVAQGNYVEAISMFERALTADAQTPAEKNLVKFSIASSKIFLGDNQSASTILKDIIASPDTVVGYDRAYAVNFFLQFFNTPAELAILYSDEPYKAFLDDSNGNHSEAEVRLIDYGLTFESIPALEIRRALNQSKKYIDLSEATTTQEEKAKSLEIIRESIVNSEKTTVEQIVSRGHQRQLAGIYNLKGLALANLYSVNETSVGSPADAFIRSLEYDLLYPSYSKNSRAIILFNYATYLGVQLDTPTNEVLKSLMLELDQLEAKDKSDLQDRIKLIAESDTKSSQWVKKSVTSLAVIFPEFNALLQNSGW